MTLLLFVAGLAGLFVGGELLIRGAVALARHFDVPPLVIGLTIVGFGTSSPELLVSVRAAWSGAPDIAIGNVLGSNIANILLILGLSAAIAPVRMPFAALRRDLAVMLGATAALWLMLTGGWVGRVEGLALLAGLGAYLWLCFATSKEAVAAEAPAVRQLPLPVSGALVAAGLVGLMIGARLLVDSATDIARALGLSEAVIGLTIVAIGTSLPELATSLMAARRGHSEIALGNVIGSNIFNILGILGLTALITPIPVDPRFTGLDTALALAVAVAPAAIALLRGRLGRRTGLTFLGLYGLYVVWLAT
jgi:cation:H+ antiporter